MIFSSSDITSLIGGDPIIKAICDIEIVDARPALKAGSGVVIYIKRYPELSEFEAKWDIWIIDYDNEPVDIVIRQLRKLLPQFTILEEGAIIKASTTELRSEKTESEIKAEPVLPQKDPYEEKFQDLIQSIEDRMLLVGPGRPGKDGKDGRDGVPGRSGRDGRDLVATDAELNDLKDVFVPSPDRGQFLMFDGASWIARYVPQIFSGGGGGGSSGGNGGGTSMPEPPSDGRYYVRQVAGGSGQWVDLLTAMNSVLDGGDFDGIEIKGDARSVVITGYSSALRIIKTIYGDTGSASISGNESSFIFNRVLSAGTGQFTVQPIIADIDADRLINTETGSVAVTGIDATINTSRKISAQVGSFVLSGNDASINTGEASTFFGDWAAQNYGYDSFIYPEWWAE